MSTHPLFDSVEAEARKDVGMMLAAVKRSAILESAKRHAMWIAKDRGEVTIDDVYAKLAWPESLGNAAGSVFKGGEWEFTGRWVKSTRKSNHSRFIRVWRLT